jgi:hypothetical protein
MKENPVKIDHLRFHLINLRINRYLLQNPQLTVVSTKQLYNFPQLSSHHSCHLTIDK